MNAALVACGLPFTHYTSWASIPHSHFIHDVHCSELAATPLFILHLVMHQAMKLLFHRLHRPSDLSSWYSLSILRPTVSLTQSVVVTIRTRSSANINSRGSPHLASFVTSQSKTANDFVLSIGAAPHSLQLLLPPAHVLAMYMLAPPPLVSATAPHLTSSWPTMVLAPLYIAITSCISHCTTPDVLMAHRGSHSTIQCHHRLYQPLLHS